MLSRFERSVPELEGVHSSGLLSCLSRFDALEGNDQLHSFLVVRHGKLIHESYWRPFCGNDTHKMFSLSKSFTSSAVGFAVQEGLIDIDRTVLSYFPDCCLDDASERMRSMTVRHVLTMTSGHAECPIGAVMSKGVKNWVRGFFGEELVHEPGSTFVYNSLATYVLSALVCRVSGCGLVDYLMPRLFEPLGIQRPHWECCPLGIETGGWGLQLRSEDIAKFGELYLRKGVWGTKRLLPESWIEMATAKQVDNSAGRVLDWAAGYGFQFWRCLPEGVYRGDGAYGQYCIVMPKQDMVVVITSAVGDMQRILNILWEELLPAIEDEALEADADAFDSLVSFSRNLVVRRSKTPGVALSSGYAGRYAMDSNDRKIAFVEFSELPAGVGLRLEHEDGNVTELRFGKDDFVVNARNWDAMDGETSAGAVSATGENSFKLDLLGLEGPFRVFWNCQWNQDGSLLIGARKNFCFFGAAQWPEMRGRKLQV